MIGWPNNLQGMRIYRVYTVGYLLLKQYQRRKSSLVSILLCGDGEEEMTCMTGEGLEPNLWRVEDRDKCIRALTARVFAIMLKQEWPRGWQRIERRRSSSLS